MKTKLISYCFNTANANEAEEYRALVARMKDEGRKRFETWGRSSHYFGEIGTVEIELDTSNLFDNQWNTSDDSPNLPARRVFDWAQDYPAGNLTNKRIERGHYLEITDEMRAIRNDTSRCGYCGKYAPTGESEFCPHCLGSQYLEEKDLPLTRMRPVSFKGERPELTEVEKAERLPLFKAAKIETGKKLAAKKLADMKEALEKKRKDDAEEYAGMSWLLERGEVKLAANCIYYSHTGRFCFGWRESLRGEIPDVLTEFPFDYDLK